MRARSTPRPRACTAPVPSPFVDALDDLGAAPDQRGGAGARVRRLAQVPASDRTHDRERGDRRDDEHDPRGDRAGRRPGRPRPPRTRRARTGRERSWSSRSRRRRGTTATISQMTHVSISAFPALPSGWRAARCAYSSASNGRRSSSCSPMPMSFTGMPSSRAIGERDAALGGAVELRQHDAGDRRRLREQLAPAAARSARWSRRP